MDPHGKIIIRNLIVIIKTIRPVVMALINTSFEIVLKLMTDKFPVKVVGHLTLSDHLSEF